MTDATAVLTGLIVIKGVPKNMSDSDLRYHKEVQFQYRFPKTLTGSI